MGLCIRVIVLAVVLASAVSCLDHRDAMDECAAAMGDWTGEECMGAVEQAGLTHGPLVGAVSDATAKIWARSDRDARMAVEYWPEASPEDLGVSSTVMLRTDRDRTGVAAIAGLEPSTRYGYRVCLPPPGDACDAFVVAESTFETLPSAGASARIRFIVAADVGGPDVPAFLQMLELAPDFVIMIGDNTYADGSGGTLRVYREKYRRVWGGAQFRELFSHVPVFMIWDDHEIVNDYWAGKNDDLYAVARQAYDEYQGSHNPDPVRRGELYYTFSAGQVEFFVLDTRTHRSPNNDPDGPDKTMLGNEQRIALENWLLSSDATVKVIVSSVTFTNYATTANDPWQGFRYERDQLFEFIESVGVSGVLLVTGDQHWSAVFRYELNPAADTPYLLYEFESTPLAFSIGVAPDVSTDEIVARDDDKNTFGVFDIDTSVSPAELAFTLCSTDRPCAPHEHSAPANAFDTEGDEETVPFTLHFTVGERGLSQ